MKQNRIIIIGGGFAGAATAYFLALSGCRRVMLLERETFCGCHASGRAAAMVRQVVAPQSMAALAREGAEFIRTWSKTDSPFLFRQTGSMLLLGNRTLDCWRNTSEVVKRAGVPASLIGPPDAAIIMPGLKRQTFEQAIFCLNDGVVDMHALLYFFLEGARARGVRIVTSACVTGVSTERGEISGVFVGGDFLRADVLINAAGAWANQIAIMAGARQNPIQSFRRHLFFAKDPYTVNADCPYVWDLENEFYYRAESHGLLLSPCDQTPHPAGEPEVDDGVQTLLAEKLLRYAPQLEHLTISNAWAGLRTISSDDRFVLGWDGTLRNLLWVAALGGHGVTCSAAVGQLAARIVLGETASSEFSPTRFSTNRP